MHICKYIYICLTFALKKCFSKSLFGKYIYTFNELFYFLFRAVVFNNRGRGGMDIIVRLYILLLFPFYFKNYCMFFILKKFLR